MRDAPKANLSIAERARAAGIDHIGIQVDSAEELGELAGRLKAAGAETFDQEATTCCYAHSDMSWVQVPAGVRSETFFPFGAATSSGAAEVLPAPAHPRCGPPAHPAPTPACRRRTRKPR